MQPVARRFMLLPLLFGLLSATGTTPYWKGRFRVTPVDLQGTSTVKDPLYEGRGKITYDAVEKNFQLSDKSGKPLMTIRLDDMRMPEKPTFNEDVDLEYHFRFTQRPDSGVETNCELSYETQYFRNARGFYDAVIKLKNAALRGDRRIEYNFGFNLPLVTTPVSVLSDSDAWDDERAADRKDEI